MAYAQGRSRNTLLLGAWRAAVLVLVACAPATARNLAEGTNAPQSTVGAALVVDGVTVVDVEAGKLIPNQRVVIGGNRIQAVGSSGAVKMPKDVQVVDARGKYLIPGLWDMHVHPGHLVRDYFYPLFIAAGVTGIREGYSTVPLDSSMHWWRDVLAGALVGPPRQLLTGMGPVTSYDDIASRKAGGANFFKVYPFSFELAEAARRAGVPFGGHVEGVSAIEASDSGINIIDHLNSSGGLDALCWGRKATVEQCRPVADRFRQNNTWVVPTLTIFGMYGALTTWKSGNLAERFVGFSRTFWTDSLYSVSGLRDSLRSDSGLRDTGSTSDSPGRLQVAHRVGLPILAGTDAGWSEGLLDQRMRWQLAGFSLHAELAAYVAEGLTSLEALQAATLNPAKLIRGTDSLGTVAPGKLADLVLLDANPLADITNTTTIRAVVANGRYYDRAALDGVLAEVQMKANRDVRAIKEP